MKRKKPKLKLVYDANKHAEKAPSLEMLFKTKKWDSFKQSIADFFLDYLGESIIVKEANLYSRDEHEFLFTFDIETPEKPHKKHILRLAETQQRREREAERKKQSAPPLPKKAALKRSVYIKLYGENFGQYLFETLYGENIEN